MTHKQAASSGVCILITLAACAASHFAATPNQLAACAAVAIMGLTALAITLGDE